MDLTLLHPSTKPDVADALAGASAEGRRLVLVGGRRHSDRGNPCEVDAELWTTQLDRVIAYDPAEMLAVVEAGIRVGELQRVLAEGEQEWPVDAPGDATVGGVIAAGVSGARRLRVGHVRDSVVELELVTGDGRLIRSGARTVKNVTGFDIHRLATGSLGTLGAIVQVALKVRPLPQARRTLVFTDGGPARGRALLEAAPLAHGVIAGPDRVEVRLEGWTAEVEELTEAARAVAGDEPYLLEDGPFPAKPIDDAPLVVEAAVPPSRIDELVRGRAGWSALLGVGLVWMVADGAEDLAEIRERAASLGGIAPVIRGPGGLGPSALPAPEVHRRLKASFDPAGILAPGRFWDEA